MMTSSIRGLILIFFFAQGVENLVFSFRSQYDGYIYPKWKKKEVMEGHFYDDAVVVGKDFMVLGDGLESTKGPSGVFTIHQCLSIARSLETCTPGLFRWTIDCVKEGFVDTLWSYGLPNLNLDMTNVANSLVYIKLYKNTLHSGVIGDSGFSIFRFNQKRNIMKLEKQSKEKVYEWSQPFLVTPELVDMPRRYTHKMKEGDVVVTFSDSVIDSLSSSFITAATNFLVGKMIEKKRDHKSLDDFDYDYDYNYDLADFVEDYIQNLSELSSKLKKQIVKETIIENKPPEQVNPIRVESEPSNISKNMPSKYQQEMKVYKPEQFPSPLVQQNQNQQLQRKNSESIEMDYPDIEDLEDIKDFEDLEDPDYQPQKKEFQIEFPSVDNVEDSQFQVSEVSENEENSENSKKPSKIKVPLPKPNNLISPSKHLSPSDSEIEEFDMKYFERIYKEKTSQPVPENPNNQFQTILQPVPEVSENHSQENIQHSQEVHENQFQEIKQTLTDHIKTHEEINEAMEKIFRFEICNFFDPSEDSRILKEKIGNKSFLDLTHHNLEHKNQKTFNDPIDCFKNINIKKTTTHHPNPTKWECKDILDLTYPIHPNKKKYHSFHECVEKAIPKLPKDTTRKEIAEAFNSRYFARNIALAVKYFSNDHRVKISNYFLRFYYNKKLKKIVFPEHKIKYREEFWKDKYEDISVAAAAVRSSLIFGKTNLKVDPSRIFKKDLFVHYNDVESWFQSNSQLKFFKNII